MATATLSRPLARRALRPVPATSRAFSQALPWLLGSVSMTMAALVGEVPWWTLAAFAACVGWRYVIERQRLAMPSFLARLLMYVPMMLGTFWAYGGHPSATAMLTFLIGLLSLKVLELRSPRDFTVVALLGYFMTLSAFFYNQSLVVSLYLGAALLGNTVALVRAHGGSGRGNLAATTRLSVVMILQTLPLVVLLFIIFPRVQGTFLKRLGDDSKGVTGMSSHLQPGSFSSLAQSTETAFRAKITSGNPTLPFPQLYWRGLVMDFCERGLSWHASELDRPADKKTPAVSNVHRIRQQITLIPQGERWMFALDHPVEVRTDPEIQASVTSSSALRSASRLVGNSVIYTAVSELSAPGGTELLDRERSWYTHTPPDLSPKVLELARGWRQQAHGQEEEIVRAALQFFRNGRFIYTLTPGELPPKAALDTFLFHTRAGFCEHYAAAFSTLMRAAGLPARVVVGYQGGEFNTWGGHYVVRQADAHAWSEVFLAGRGWVREDPTAVVAPDRVSFGADDYSSLMADGPLTEESRLERLRRMQAPSTLRWLAHNTLMAWDGLDQQWNVLVLGYDQEQQWVFLDKLGLGRLSWVGGTMLTLAAAFSLLATGTLSYRWWEHRGTRAAGDQERRLYGRFCRCLTAAGVTPRADREGPLDFAQRAAAALPAAAADIRRITDLYIALRYARPDAAAGTADLAVRFRTAVAAFHPSRVSA